MSEAASARLGLPELPKLDPQDLEAIRRFLPGKLLGRLAALLGILLLVLSFAGAVDLGLRQFFGVDLSGTPWLRGLVLFGLPSSIVLAQVVVEWRAARVAAAQRLLAVAPAAVPAGYFRIGPYADTEADRAAFARADRAHEVVLRWLRETEGAPLYLTGQSGCGKSSLLQAFVVPCLRAAGWTVAEARAWQDPEAALREALRNLPGAPRSRAGAAPSLRALVEGVAKRAESGLLVLLDQFEEFAILQEEAPRAAFAALLTNLHRDPVPKLRLVLAFRSDYRPALDDLELPPLREGENWQEVGAFGRRAAADFLARAGLGLQPAALDALLESAAVLDDLAGLIRPVTLNVVGHVLAEGRERAPSLDAGALVRGYVAQVIGAPELRDRAPAVLEQLLTAQATKRPRSEEQIGRAAGLRLGEVRAVLSGLARAGIARPLDPERGVWELSHDFVARVVSRHLGQGRRAALRRAAAYAAPALLVATCGLGAGAVAWERMAEDRAIRSLAEQGMSVSEDEDEPGFLHLESTPVLTQEKLESAAPMLRRFAPRLLHANLSGRSITDLRPLSSLAALRSLDLSYNRRVADLSPLSGLAALQRLDLSENSRVADLSPLSSLAALERLDLSDTSVADLSPLSGLAALQYVDLPDSLPAEARRTFDESRPVRGLRPFLSE